MNAADRVAYQLGACGQGSTGETNSFAEHLLTRTQQLFVLHDKACLAVIDGTDRPFA